MTIAVLAALPPASAPAATTIGSDLSRAGDTPGYCTGDGPGSACTVLQLTLGADSQAVPSDGVVTCWSVRDAGGVLGLRVIDGSPGQWRVVASGPPVQVPGPGVQTFPAQIPVVAGQRVGVELGEASHLPFRYRDEGATTGEQFTPPLGAVPTAGDAGAALSRT